MWASTMKLSRFLPAIAPAVPVDVVCASMQGHRQPRILWCSGCYQSKKRVADKRADNDSEPLRKRHGGGNHGSSGGGNQASSGSEPIVRGGPKTLMEEADRAENYVLGLNRQPGRVSLDEFGFHQGNRGGQGIMPIHVHDIALDIVTEGTSLRRYDTVRCVVVPEECRAEWLAANTNKTKQNSLLPSCTTNKMWLATLKCTHFVGACKLIKDGR